MPTIRQPERQLAICDCNQFARRKRQGVVCHGRSAGAKRLDKGKIKETERPKTVQKEPAVAKTKSKKSEKDIVNEPKEKKTDPKLKAANENTTSNPVKNGQNSSTPWNVVNPTSKGLSLKEIQESEQRDIEIKIEICSCNYDKIFLQNII